MHRSMNNQRGFSLAEVLIVVALLGILSSIVLLNLGGSDTAAKERTLKGNLQALRSAVKMYHSDHGRYPCSSGDYNYPCSDEEFRRKLTRYSRLDGRTSQNKNATYTYGPYLDDFPVEPFSASDSLTWALNSERLKESLANEVDGSNGNGGWYYEPESGNIIANLGSDYPNDYAGF